MISPHINTPPFAEAYLAGVKGAEREARVGSGGCAPKYSSGMGVENNALVQPGLL